MYALAFPVERDLGERASERGWDALAAVEDDAAVVGAAGTKELLRFRRSCEEWRIRFLVERGRDEGHSHLVRQLVQASGERVG